MESKDSAFGISTLITCMDLRFYQLLRYARSDYIHIKIKINSQSIKYGK